MLKKSFSFKKLVGRSSLCLFLMFLMSATAVNAEEKTLIWKAVAHNKEVKVIKVGDIEGHIMGVAKFSGLAIFDSGEVGGTGYTVNFDYTNGSGPFNGHAALAFDDGSRLWMSYEGSSVKDAEGVTRFEGKYVEFLGEGKYKGVKGAGSFTGKRVNLMEGGGESIINSKVRLDMSTE